jgi:hypothetical protein
MLTRSTLETSSFEHTGRIEHLKTKLEKSLPGKMIKKFTQRFFNQKQHEEEKIKIMN